MSEPKHDIQSRIYQVERTLRGNFGRSVVGCSDQTDALDNVIVYYDSASPEVSDLLKFQAQGDTENLGGWFVLEDSRDMQP